MVYIQIDEQGIVKLKKRYTEKSNAVVMSLKKDVKNVEELNNIIDALKREILLESV